MIDRPPVLVTRRLPHEVMQYLDEHCLITLNEEDRPMPRERLLAEVKGKRGVLPMLTDRIDGELLDAAGAGLAVVANYAVGYDNVDVAACTDRGVLVTNTPDVLTDATADMTWSLILAASRRLGEGERLIRAGGTWGWAPEFMLGREVTGKTLGVVGLGRIGQAVAARARGFRMRILYHSRTRKADAEAALDAEYRDLPQLLSEAEVISVHVSLSQETHHLFGTEEFRAMKRSAVFVNTTRGAVVDEEGLAIALSEGQIFAAGLDVYEREPEVHPHLLGLDNVVLVPHLGSATVETRTAMGMLAAENLVAALEGRSSPSIVNPEVLDRPA